MFSQQQKQEARFTHPILDKKISGFREDLDSSIETGKNRRLGVHDSKLLSTYFCSDAIGPVFFKSLWMKADDALYIFFSSLFIQGNDNERSLLFLFDTEFLLSISSQSEKKFNCCTAAEKWHFVLRGVICHVIFCKKRFAKMTKQFNFTFRFFGKINVFTF